MRKILPIILITVIILAGCSKETVVSENEVSQSEISSTGDTLASITDNVFIEEHINESVSSNILFDADILYPSSASMEVYPVENLTFDIDKLEDFFVKDDSGILREHGDEYDFITTKDQSILSKNEYSFEYITPFAANYLSNVVNWTYYMEFGSMNLANQVTDLDFSTKNDIEARFLSDLGQLGIQKSVHTEVYSMTYQEMSTIEDIMVKSGEYSSEIEAGLISPKGEWDTTDDCYFITAELSPNGATPIVNVEIPLGEYTWIDPSYIWAVYSERGIEFFHVEHPYSNQSASPEQVAIITIDAAKQIITNKLDSILTNNQYTINRMKMSYIPRMSETKLELIPVWFATVTEEYISEEGKISKGEESSVNYFTILIDAETGNEIR